MMKIQLPPSSHKRVAVVGSGPAGMCCAGELARLGHQVTLLEALHKPGGVLAYGIPDFRLPKWIVENEFLQLERMGVKIECNMPIGPLKSVPDLMREGIVGDEGAYDAVSLCIGAGAPIFLGIPGENYNGVLSANEFLTRINLMRATDDAIGGDISGSWTPVLGDEISGKKRLAVIGAGNTAMDVARSAVRLTRRWGGEVYMIYRRPLSEAPARKEEVHHMLDEGVNFIELTNPVEVLAGDDGWVNGLRCTKNEVTEGLVKTTGKNLRRAVKLLPDSEHFIPMDVIIPCICTMANEVLPSTFTEMELTNKGYIIADAHGATNVRGVYAAGDIVTGAATVIEAGGLGQRCAQAIDKWLRTDMAHWPQRGPAKSVAKLA